MRVEDLVGLSFFAMVLTGVALILYGSQRKTQGERAWWQGVGLIAEGFAFLAFGSATLYFLRTSPRPQVEGYIWDVRQSFGRSHNSTRFMLTNTAGKAVQIRCKYHGTGIREGEKVRIRFIEYNHELLDMTVLDGPYELWQLQESSGEWNTLALTLIGLACGIGGFRELRKAAASAPDPALLG